MPPRDELSLCAQVSLRYEMPYLLPWLAYHTLLGFDRILLYLDDLSHLGLTFFAPAAVSVLLGHIVHCLMLMRPALSVFGALYQFSDARDHEPRRLVTWSPICSGTLTASRSKLARIPSGTGPLVSWLAIGRGSRWERPS